MASSVAALAFIQVLALSDIHYDHTANQISYFQDTGTQLWTNAKAKMQDVLATQHPAFIVLLGDLPAHTNILADRQLDDQTVLQDLRATVGTTPLFYIPGNNDALGGNYHSFTYTDGRNPTSLDPAGSWPGLNTVDCAKAAKGQACTLDKPDNFKFGYYSVYPLGPDQKLRLIGLNSIIFVKGYVSDDGVAQDLAATEELTWLEAQLKDAESKHEAVMIGMHVPPGRDFAGNVMWSTGLPQFIGMLQRYKDTVSLMMSSHTHFDELRLVNDTTNNLAVLGISFPSVSPVHGNNSTLKVLSLDPQTFAMTDAKTTFTPPNAATWGDQWYAFDADYGCEQGAPVRECLAHKPLAQIEAGMNAEYSGHYDNNMLNYTNIDAAIYVNHPAIP